MNILLRSDGGPVEGFRSAAFRVAISDEGFGEIVALPEDLENVSGTVVASVDGTDVFAWRVEDREAFAGDADTVTVTGRGRLASLERAVVLPAGYPNFTTRTRTEQGPPFAVWANLLSEAQGRGRAVGLTPTWTASEDSQGQPWQEVVDFELEPGVTLADLLLEVAEVEGAEWIIRPDGLIDAARGLGVDRSSEVVLFVGHNQISRGRRESSRNQRQTVFLEASTGVSEVTNDYTDADAGEIWLEGQDFSDPLSRELVAEKLASKLAEPEVEVEVAVDPECGVFDRFNVGDVIGLDTGREGIEPVRVIGATVSVNEEGVEVELTLVSQVALRQQQIDRAIEAKADVKLAAGATLQRRHGLVTADKFLSGAVGDEVAISSENYIPGVQGWVITGDGDVEFNDGTFRGDLQSDNYVPDVSGWKLSQDGDAEFANIQLRDTMTFIGDPLQTIDNLRIAVEMSDRSLTMGYLGPADEPAGVLSAIVEVPNQTLPPAAFRGVTLSAATGQRLLVQRQLVALDSDNGDILLAGNASTGGIFLDASVIVSAANHQFNGAINVDGAASMQSTLFVANDANVAGQLDIDQGATVGAGFSVLSGQASFLGNLFVAGTTSMANNLSVIGTTSSTFFVGDGSGLTNLPTPSIPSDPTFNVVDANQYRFRSGAAFPRLDRDGSNIQLRTAGSVKSKGDSGFIIEDGLTTIAFTPNCFIGGSGRLFIGSSTRATKTDIAYGQIAGVLDLQPAFYMPIVPDGEPTPLTRQYGLIAEDVEEAGVVELVGYAADGSPQSVNYDRVGVALIPYVRDLVERVTALEERGE